MTQNSNHSINIYQLRSQSGKSFLNVEDRDYGRLEVWGSCHKYPVFLFQDGIRFYLEIFDDAESADEWLRTYGKNYKTCVKLEPLEE